MREVSWVQALVAHLCALSLWLCGCGPSVDDLVERLADPADRESARQELLLAKGRAVTPLLTALADSSLEGSRLHVVEVLLSLMARLEDARIGAALERHLRGDSQPEVRALIAHRLGLRGRAEVAEVLVDALQVEADSEVCYELLLGLNRLGNKLSDEHKERAHARALLLLDDADEDTRVEARIRLAVIVDEWIDEALKAVLAADLDQATDLFRKASAAYPHSKRANYRLGRHELEVGRTEEGLARLRRHGMLLDVPRLPRAPVVDGRLDDAAWATAARADTFYQFSHAHSAAIASELRTELFVGSTDEALFIGFRGHDDHPDSIVVTDTENDGAGLFWEDMIEIFLDTDFDHRGYIHAGINTRGAITDGYLPNGRPRGNVDHLRVWDGDSDVATHIGASFWSMEYRLRFGQPEVPPPRPGTIWGFNFARTFRGKEYGQWVRVYGLEGAHTPNDFGLLRFR